MPDIIIVGGGITGLATACELAAAGVSVAVFEARHFGAMASTWTLGGVRQSGRDPAELPLAQAAIERWSTWHEELGGETGYRREGNLRLARSEAEVEVIKAMVAQQRDLGLTLDFLPDSASIRGIAPTLGEGILAASFCPGDGHADPDRTIASLAGAARRMGVDLREGQPVRALRQRAGRVNGVDTDDGPVEAAVVIVTCGLFATAMLAPLGLALPMAAKRVCVVQTVPMPPAFRQVFGVANADCAGRQELDGRYRFTTGIGDWPGDLASWSESSLRPTIGEIAGLFARVVPILPLLATAGLDRVWGGLIDLTPDALPVLDAPPGFPGLVVGSGFSGHGFGIGPVSGQILKALALNESTNFNLEPFRLGRFNTHSGFAPLTSAMIFSCAVFHKATCLALSCSVRAASISASATLQCEKLVTAVGVFTIEREWKNWVR
jgi:sarcosine oxidase subunit beta